MNNKSRIAKMFANLNNVNNTPPSSKVEGVITEETYSVNANGYLTLESIVECSAEAEAEKQMIKVCKGIPKNILITNTKDMLNRLEDPTLQVQAEIHKNPVKSPNIHLNDYPKKQTSMKTIVVDQSDMISNFEDIALAPQSPSILNNTSNNYSSSNDSDVSVKKPKRNKQAAKNSWKKTKNMKNREEGKEYQSRSKVANGWKYDNPKNKRKIKPRCNCKLSNKNTKLQCSQINEEDRIDIFNNFWKLSWKEKKIYVKALVVVKPTARKRGNHETSKRNNSLELYLDKTTSKIRVCKKMFLNTLSVGEWALKDWARKKKQSENKRTVGENINTKTKKQQIKHFFDQLPKLESHYCRKSSSKLYLETVWESKAQLLRFYNNIFVKENNYNRVSICTFSEVFEDMNLSLYQPKKDACDLCEQYKTKNTSEEVYRAHIEKKEAARREKESDKLSNKEVFTMDLQAVQLCPKSNVSSLYFKTKLAVHNFTAYDIKRSEGYCFLWNESEGGLTANEFASVIVRMLEIFVVKNSIAEGSEIVLFSDGCTYQNRNVTLSNALLNFAMLYRITIVQKILEKGHTQMEADSMHSVIERKVRNRKINVPADYVQIAKTSCIKKPYYVEYLHHDFFKNFETSLNFYKSIRPGMKSGDPVVTDLRQLRYSPEGVIYYRLGFTNDCPELVLNLRRRCKKIEPCRELPPLYRDRLKIKKSKFIHLQELKLTMESDFHAFYDSLPHHD